MNKIEKMLLVFGISAAAAFLILYSVDDWLLASAGVIAVFLISLLLVDPLDSKAEKVNEKEAEEAEAFGIEVKATVDSRIYERPSIFLGLYFLFVFGGALATNMKVYFP